MSQNHSGQHSRHDAHAMAQRKQSKPHGFRRLIPLAGGLLLAGAIGAYVLFGNGGEKKTPVQNGQTQTSSSAVARVQMTEVEAVNLAKKIILSVPYDKQNPTSAYAAVRDSLNAAEISVGGIVISIPNNLADGETMMKKPDAKYYIPFQNDEQPNTVAFAYDPRLKAFAQFLDVIGGGNGLDIAPERVIDLVMLSYSRGKMQIYPSYSVEDILSREDAACMDFAILLGSIYYSFYIDVIPIQTEPFYISNDEKIPLYASHIVLGLPQPDGKIQILDPVEQKKKDMLLASVEGYMFGSNDSKRSVREMLGRASPDAQTVVYALVRLPTEKELTPFLAAGLSRNDDKSLAMRMAMAKFNKAREQRAADMLTERFGNTYQFRSYGLDQILKDAGVAVFGAREILQVQKQYNL